MPIQILQQDIITLACDVLVNPTDERFSGSGGVDAAVHRVAGFRLRRACDRLAPLNAGEVCCTKGYGLKSRHIIHTVGPRWQGGEENEAALLRGCYTKALVLSEQLGAKTVAFPLISSGTFGFPKNQVLRIALDAISTYLLTVPEEPEVLLCVPDRRAYSLNEEDGLKTFLAAAPQSAPVMNAVERPRLFGEPTFAAFGAAGFRPQRQSEPDFEAEDETEPETEACEGEVFDLEEETCLGITPEHDADTDADEELSLFDADDSGQPDSLLAASCFDTAELPRELKRQMPPHIPAPRAEKKPAESLEEWLKQQDDSFAVTLLKLIDKKGMTDVECYKRANVSRKTFSKINTQKGYRPSKQTVLAFAVGLRLSLDETQTLLRSAGFSLSPSTADRIVEYFIRCGNYDIFEINAALYQYDQVLLGC